jgi:hypothetical protein
MSKGEDGSGWDSPLAYIDGTFAAELQRLIAVVARNDPVALPDEDAPHSTDICDYDHYITVDACATGWAAFVHVVATQETILVRQSWWDQKMRFSTVSEPTAVVRIFSWLRERFGRAPNGRKWRVALVTDHMAIASGQRRWKSHNGGFSTQQYLNDAFRVINTAEVETTVFHVHGDDNIADGPSRTTDSPYEKATLCGLVVLPTLHGFFHPEDAAPRRAAWMV